MKFWLCFIVLTLFTACSTKNLNEQKSFKDSNETKTEISHFANLEFKQDINLLSGLKTKAKFDAKAYKKRFFAPWHTSFKNFKKEQIFWSFPTYLNPKNSYYFFNKIKIEKSYFKKLIQNANTKDFAKLNKKALITQNCILKNLPTQKEILKNPFLQSEGIPFNYASDLVLNIATPVLISHFSKDKRYAFVLSEAGSGFVESENLEIFTEQRAKIYENLNFITPLKEKSPILSDDNKFFFESRIGGLYPYYKEDKYYFYGKIGSKKFKISKNEAKKFPLEFNDENLKNQLKELLALPYGWGGYGFERDCSLFVRDIFSSFGLYMPRNSKAQKNTFTNFDISFLSNAKKEEFLNKFGKAYLSLLYMPGHIMLYVGNLEGKSVVLQSIWGLRQNENDRLLLGSSVLTSLEIGKNQIPNENLLLSRLTHISFISLSQKESEQIKAFLKANQALVSSPNKH